MRRRSFLKAALGAAAAVVIPIPAAPPAKVFGISKEAYALWNVPTAGEKDWGTISPIIYADLIGDYDEVERLCNLKYGGTHGRRR